MLHLVLSHALSLALAASPSGNVADDIDQLFEKASTLERAGDCAAAAAVYGEVESLSQSLAPADRARVQSQVKSREQRKKSCIEACTLSDKDKKQFETAKAAKAAGETKRVAEICKQVLHGKSASCSAYNEIRTFCPTLGENADPCTSAPAEAKADMERLEIEVGTLQTKATKAAAQAKGGSPAALDAIVALNRDLETAYERLFSLRETFFNCDKTYASLKEKANELSISRNALRTAAAASYRARLGKLTSDLEALKKNNADLSKSNMELGQKVEALTQFTNDVTMDVVSLAQAESVSTSVKVEGAEKGSSEQLAKVLAGDREAIEDMIKQHSDYFSENKGRARLVRKKEALQRLEGMLGKFSEQGYGERLGFKKAQQEVRATLALVNHELPPDSGDDAGGGRGWVPYAIGLGFLLAVVALAVMLSRRAEPAPKSLLSLTPKHTPAPSPSPKKI